MKFHPEGPFRVEIYDWADHSYFVFDEGMAKRSRAFGYRVALGAGQWREESAQGRPVVNCGLWVHASEPLSVGDVVRGRLSYDPTVALSEGQARSDLPVLTILRCLSGGQHAAHS